MEGVLRPLLKILGGGFVAFMVLAIAQDWRYFSAAWFGAPAPAPELSAEDEKAAADTVHLVLSLMRHFYVSGGDPRYAERMPASDSVIAEMRADIDYLARNQRTQDPALERLEVLSAEPLDADRLVVRTRERWRFRILWVATAAEAEPARLRTVHGRYLLVREPKGWQVAAWNPDEPAETTGAAGS